MIDQFLPAKASQLRQKMTEMGMPPSPGLPYAAQTVNGIQSEPTADSLVQAASTAPPQMQSRIYQQAAYKALEEGDTERARQIATDHLQSNVRDAVMKRLALKTCGKLRPGYSQTTRNSICCYKLQTILKRAIQSSRSRCWKTHDS
jgi:hypothetical protein